MAPMKRPISTGPRRTLTLDQVARRWGLPRRRVRRLLQKRELPFEEVRGQIRVPVDSVRCWESAHKEKQEKQPCANADSNSEAAGLHRHGANRCT